MFPLNSPLAVSSLSSQGSHVTNARHDLLLNALPWFHWKYFSRIVFSSDMKAELMVGQMRNRYSAKDDGDHTYRKHVRYHYVGVIPFEYKQVTTIWRVAAQKHSYTINCCCQIGIWWGFHSCGIEPATEANFGRWCWLFPLLKSTLVNPNQQPAAFVAWLMTRVKQMTNQFVITEAFNPEPPRQPVFAARRSCFSAGEFFAGRLPLV